MGLSGVVAPAARHFPEKSVVMRSASSRIRGSTFNSIAAVFRVPLPNHKLTAAARR